MADIINNKDYKFESINRVSDRDVFASMSSIDEKKFFLKLRKEYLIINNIKDYKERQNKLYEGKTRREIIDLEIARIRKSDGYSNKVEEQIIGILELLELIGSDLTDELYEKIINLIIKIELSLDMKIGLFEELCVMFNKEMENIIKENNQLEELGHKRTRGE